MMVDVKTTDYAADEFAGSSIPNLPSSLRCIIAGLPRPESGLAVRLRSEEFSFAIFAPLREILSAACLGERSQRSTDKSRRSEAEPR